MTQAIAESADGVAAARPATLNIAVKFGEDEERIIGAVPGSRIVVLFGESHMAPQHLPAALMDSSRIRRLARSSIFRSATRAFFSALAAAFR